MNLKFKSGEKGDTMKIKIMAMTLLVSVFLAGCQSQVTTDNRMKDSSLRENALEYDAYRKNIVDSEFTWYSKYVNQYLVDIKDGSNKVDPNDIKSLIGEVDSKIDEIKKLDTDKIKAAIDKEAEDISKNDKDDNKYKTEIKKVKENVGRNKESMLRILTTIKAGLELGQDGQFDQDDIKKISEMQTSLLKFYDKNLKSY